MISKAIRVWQKGKDWLVFAGDADRDPLSGRSVSAGSPARKASEGGAGWRVHLTPQEPGSRPHSAKRQRPSRDQV